MAKTKKAKNDALVERLRALGVRKGTARKISKATRSGADQATKVGGRAFADLTAAVAEAQDRISQGPAKRKAAAKKAAKTRAANAEKRSEAAKKAARTRAKK